MINSNHLKALSPYSMGKNMDDFFQMPPPHFRLKHMLMRNIRRVLRRIPGMSGKELYDRYLGLDFRPPEQRREFHLKKKALVSYITHPFFVGPADPAFFRHNNYWHAHAIVWVLNSLGFEVDIIDYRDEHFVLRKHYDLFLGHGEATFISLASRLPPSAVKIYFATGNYWKYRNQAINKRYHDLHTRRGKLFSPRRLSPAIQENVLNIADGVVGIGSTFCKETFPDRFKVFMVDNTVLPYPEWDPTAKDWETARTHFLYFGGDDNIRKGLDLLLEVFPGFGDRAHLWICAYIDDPEKQCYHSELHETGNIHLMGFITPRQETFFELMRRCGFVILPSASEGQPHSVLEGMHFGLIPLASPACSIDTGEFGFLLPTCGIEEIRETIEHCLSLGPDKCAGMAMKARRETLERYTPTAFIENLTDALKQLLHG